MSKLSQSVPLVTVLIFISGFSPIAQARTSRLDEPRQAVIYIGHNLSSQKGLANRAAEKAHQEALRSFPGQSAIEIAPNELRGGGTDLSSQLAISLKEIDSISHLTIIDDGSLLGNTRALQILRDKLGSGSTITIGATQLTPLKGWAETTPDRIDSTGAAYAEALNLKPDMTLGLLYQKAYGHSMLKVWAIGSATLGTALGAFVFALSPFGDLASIAAYGQASTPHQVFDNVVEMYGVASAALGMMTSGEVLFHELDPLMHKSFTQSYSEVMPGEEWIHSRQQHLKRLNRPGKTFRARY